MASSSMKPVKARGGSSSSKGDVRTSRGPEDNDSSSDSVLGSPEPHGDILGQPILDPWYRSSERFPFISASLQPPPVDWEWLVIREDAAADVAWTPNFREIRDLQIQRNEMLAVPLVFDFQCSRAVEWADWIDSELTDREFCDCLEQAGVLRSILISRCSNMYCDTEALRQLVQRWCPSTHTFFFAHGEITVTLEDVGNHWLLPILGNQGPADLALSPEELEIESALADYIGRKNIALGTQATRFKSWMEHFNRKTDPSIPRTAFVAYWLSKCVFGEHPAYSIKPLYFPLTVKIAAGVCFPLAPLLLGQIYTQLDLLHAKELAGASCHIVTTAFNSSIMHTFLWEHALEYIRKGRKPYEGRNKFTSMPDGVVANVGDFQGDVPAVYHWVGSKFYDHSLISSLDSESKVCWRPYGVSHRGFVYESVMSGFSNIEAQDYTLVAGDMASLTYLSTTNAGWLPVLSPDGLRFTVYSAHRVRKQFGFDQEVPAIMGVTASEISIINPFLGDRAFAYWSSAATRVIIPNGDRIGVYTIDMSNYWRGLMAVMVEFRNSGKGDISHLLESYTSPLPHPRLFVATNTMTTYANRQSLGYVVWHHDDSRWVIHGSPHPLLWFRDHPHVAASGKVPSSKGRRIASTAAIASPPLAREDVPQGVSAPISKKPVKKTRARKKTFVPPAFPSAPSSMAARVAACKSSRGVVYSEKRQRANTSSRVPIEIPDDLDSSSSSSDSSRAIEEEVERESVGADAAKIASGVDDFAADISSVDASAISSTSSEKRSVSAGIDTKDNEVSLDELEAAEASSDSTPVTSASKPVSTEEAVKEHATVRVVTGAEKVVETTPVAVTSSGGTVQGGPSGSSSHVDPSLLDSSPSTRQYVRKARRGSIVSTDSERTGSATVRVSTPASPLPESGGIASTPIIIAAAVSAATIVQESETAPAAVGGVPDSEEAPTHIFEVPEGIAQAEHVEVAVSEDPVQAEVIPGSDVPIIEEELAQDPVDDIDMADAYDSYDEVLAEVEDDVAGAQAADTGATAPVATHGSPTETAGSGNEAVAEEERIHQSAAVESTIRGQPELVFAARPAISRTSVLADMDAFFREFDRTSFSSCHAEHFWTFDDRKADFEIFRVPQGGIRFLKALWNKYGSCSSYFRLGVHVGSSMLTLLCCVLAHMEYTRLEDITEIHILEWKAVVQEAIEGGFRFGFILDYLRRLAHSMFSRRVLAELREAEARVAALRDALNIVATNPWDLASARRASTESNVGSALHDLLA
uniref:Aminotransferase-like plant mobile domain-containing protein n=1 Tax=Fagus sylvatica TaxID=28930 RepID=A0A2N9FRU8_FAGSY